MRHEFMGYMCAYQVGSRREVSVKDRTLREDIENLDSHHCCGTNQQCDAWKIASCFCVIVTECSG
jgi:hypothetical protein